MEPESPAVRIQGLTKRLGRVTALNGVDLRVERGQVVGLAGPNGAGKSVTLKILLGLVRPTSGQVEIFGEAVRPGSPVLARVGALVDGPGFVPHLSGTANLRVSARTLGRPVSSEAFDRAIATAGLGEAIDRKYHTYSHGMRYRLGLAQALLGQPDLLLLDEPTTGLDPGHVNEIRRTIRSVAADGAAILLSSHQMREVEEVCTHAAVMNNGRVLAFGSLAELTATPGPAEGGLEEAYLRLVAGA